jgi:hypothetical protein
MLELLFCGSVLSNVFISRSSAEAFRNAIIVKKNTKFPIVQIGTASFFWIRESNVYIAACANRDVNAAIVFEALHRLVTVFKAYFLGVFNEEKVNRFSGLIFELLDGLYLVLCFPWDILYSFLCLNPFCILYVAVSV